MGAAHDWNDGRRRIRGKRKGPAANSSFLATSAHVPALASAKSCEVACAMGTTRATSGPQGVLPQLGGGVHVFVRLTDRNATPRILLGARKNDV